MKKVITFYLKPTRPFIYSVVVAPLFLVIMLFLKPDNIIDLITGMVTGAYGGLFWVLFSARNSYFSSFAYGKLLYSLPVKRERIMKPWYIANHLSLAYMYFLLMICVVAFEIISPSHSFNYQDLVSIVIMMLTTCLLFNLYLPLNFSNSKRTIPFYILLFLFGITSIPVSTVIYIELQTSTLWQLLYILVYFLVVAVSTIWSYKMSQKRLLRISCT